MRSHGRFSGKLRTSFLFILPVMAQAGLAAAGNNATMAEQNSSVPATAGPGALVTVRVQAVNTGDTTWRAGSAHRLGVGPSNQVSWSGFPCGGYMNNLLDGRVFLCRDVAPGQAYDFQFNVQLPSSGSAVLSVRMVQDGVEWFGENQTWSLTVSGGTACATSPLPTPADQWKLEIFNNKALSGSAVEERYDAAGSGGFAFDWGTGRASNCTGVDNFGVRFSRTVAIDTAGDYKFTTTTDDGVRLWVDGQRLVDRWVDQGPTSYSATKYLAAGSHDVRMEYYENGGGAYAAIRWEITGNVCATSPLATPADRWKLEIFDNRALSGSPIEQRYDAAGSGGFTFDWANGRPSVCTGVDNFGVRFGRTIAIATTGNYQFTTTTDDGVRLWVDGQLLIDRWIDQAPTSYGATRSLAAGSHDVRMDYYENGGGAYAALRWEQVANPDPDPAIKWDNRLDSLGVQLVQAQAAPGTWYWKLVEARFESDGEIFPPPGGGSESQGTHAIYFRAVNADGQLLENQEATVSWPNGNPTNNVSVRTKGPVDGYWGNFPMAGGWCPFYPDGPRGSYGARMAGAPSDQVWGMGMPCSRHVSYRLIWNWTQRAASASGGASVPVEADRARGRGLPRE